MAHTVNGDAAQGAHAGDESGVVEIAQDIEDLRAVFAAQGGELLGACLIGVGQVIGLIGMTMPWPSSKLNGIGSGYFFPLSPTSRFGRRSIMLR